MEQKRYIFISFLRIPHIDSKVSQNNFYSAIEGELLTARITLSLNKPYTKSQGVTKTHANKGSKGNKINNILKNIMLAHP